MLFEETPKFKSKMGRKLFRESAEKPMSAGQKAKFKRYMERELGGKKDVSSREFRVAEKKAMKRFRVGRGASAPEISPPSTPSEAPKPNEMLRDKIAREKMPPSLHDAAMVPPRVAEGPPVKRVGLAREAMPEELRNLIEHKPPKKPGKPPKDS